MKTQFHTALFCLKNSSKCSCDGAAADYSTAPTTVLDSNDNSHTATCREHARTFMLLLLHYHFIYYTIVLLLLVPQSF